MTDDKPTSGPAKSKRYGEARRIGSKPYDIHGPGQINVYPVYAAIEILTGIDPLQVAKTRTALDYPISDMELFRACQVIVGAFSTMVAPNAHHVGWLKKVPQMFPYGITEQRAFVCMVLQKCRRDSKLKVHASLSNVVPEFGKLSEDRIVATVAAMKSDDDAPVKAAHLSFACAAFGDCKKQTRDGIETKPQAINRIASAYRAALVRTASNSSKFEKSGLFRHQTPERLKSVK